MIQKFLYDTSGVFLLLLITGWYLWDTSYYLLAWVDDNGIIYELGDDVWYMMYDVWYVCTILVYDDVVFFYDA